MSTDRELLVKAAQSLRVLLTNEQLSVAHSNDELNDAVSILSAAEKHLNQANADEAAKGEG